jgi:hypothetical protein
VALLGNRAGLAAQLERRVLLGDLLQMRLRGRRGGEEEEGVMDRDGKRSAAGVYHTCMSVKDARNTVQSSGGGGSAMDAMESTADATPPPPPSALALALVRKMGFVLELTRPTSGSPSEPYEGDRVFACVGGVWKVSEQNWACALEIEKIYRTHELLEATFNTPCEGHSPLATYWPRR